MNTQEAEIKSEEFLEGESLVIRLMKLIDDVANSTKREGDSSKPEVKKEYAVPPINENKFIVVDRDSKIHNTFHRKGSIPSYEAKIDHFAFINQIDCNKEKREKMMLERERVAQNLRSLGNYAYRECNFKNAIFYYTKGLELIHDTPVLYCNRALCYAKMGNYPFALLDLDLVVTKYDPNSVRGWLYKAACYFRLGDEKNYQTAVSTARLYNPEAQKFIDNFIKRIPSDF